MKVVVASPEEDCGAHRALEAEGVPHELLLCQGDLDYGEHLARLWREGEGFVLIEWDVVPWPTAIKSLADCPFHWCDFSYPMSPGTPYGNPDCLGDALGCVKFGQKLMRRFPNLPERWRGQPWWLMDGLVLGAVREAQMVTVHEHLPPVAHLKEPV